MKILLIDNDKDLLSHVEKVLKTQGHNVLVKATAQEGLKNILSFRPDLVMLEVMLETDTAGFEFLYQLRDERADSRYNAVKNTPVVFLSGITQATHSRFSLSDKDGYLPKFSAFITKPAKDDDVLATVKEALS